MRTRARTRDSKSLHRACTRKSSSVGLVVYVGMTWQLGEILRSRTHPTNTGRPLFRTRHTYYKIFFRSSVNDRHLFNRLCLCLFVYVSGAACHIALPFRFGSTVVTYRRARARLHVTSMTHNPCSLLSVAGGAPHRREESCVR